MDDKIRRAEELLEQRARERGPNGHGSVDTETPSPEGEPATPTSEQRAEEHTN